MATTGRALCRPRSASPATAGRCVLSWQWGFGREVACVESHLQSDMHATIHVRDNPPLLVHMHVVLVQLQSRICQSRTYTCRACHVRVRAPPSWSWSRVRFLCRPSFVRSAGRSPDLSSSLGFVPPGVRGSCPPFLRGVPGGGLGPGVCLEVHGSVLGGYEILFRSCPF
jgi:hypothetical protein